MRLLKLIPAAALSVCIALTPVFAAPAGETGQNVKVEQKANGKKVKKIDGECKERQHDPVKALEQRKERVQNLLKEGKLSKQEADEHISRIDTKIKEIKAFEKLPLDQKKSKLMDNFKVRLERKVKDGTITEQQADDLLKQFSKKVNEWDGNGYPKFFGKGFKHPSGFKHDKKP